MIPEPSSPLPWGLSPHSPYAIVGANGAPVCLADEGDRDFILAAVNGVHSSLDEQIRDKTALLEALNQNALLRMEVDRLKGLVGGGLLEPASGK